MANVLPNIIGLCGRQYSGKTMLGKYLVKNYGYERIYIASALKKLSSKILNLSIEEMDRLKTANIEFKLKDTDLKFIAEELNIPIDIVIKKFETINNALKGVRHTYQFIGTDLIREYNPDWHINMLLKEINPNNKYVVDDVRFPNEADALLKQGALLIYNIRPELINISHHASEESLRWQDIGTLIINNQTKDFALSQLEDIIHGKENNYAIDKLEEYYKNILTLNSNKKIVIEQELCPAHVTIHDRTIGWISGDYNGIDNPLVIEDIKKFI